VKISILKGKGLNLRAEPPRIKLYWVIEYPPGGGGYMAALYAGTPVLLGRRASGSRRNSRISRQFLFPSEKAFIFAM